MASTRPRKQRDSNSLRHARIPTRPPSYLSWSARAGQSAAPSPAPKPETSGAGAYRAAGPVTETTGGPSRGKVAASRSARLRRLRAGEPEARSPKLWEPGAALTRKSRRQSTRSIPTTPRYSRSWRRCCRRSRRSAEPPATPPSSPRRFRSGTAGRDHKPPRRARRRRHRGHASPAGQPSPGVGNRTAGTRC